MTILAIETSCDETAAAVVTNRNILSSVVASQIELHQAFGGVVPEVASRQHVLTIQGVIAEALATARQDWPDIEAIAVTCAPGLAGALMVGVMAAKTLALVHQKPLLGIHHLEGHIFSGMLAAPDLHPPFLCLLVSGGHTSLIAVRGVGAYEIVGQTCDDAAGEAFDKVARLLDLGYPGGPPIDRLAATGNGNRFPLPEGKVDRPYHTSFSGLKTAVRRLVQQWPQQHPDEPLPVADLAASFQATVVRVLTRKAIACATDLGLGTIVITGGVAANRGLRQSLQAAGAAQGLRVVVPPFSLCTDNAAMIGAAAAAHWALGHQSPLSLGVQSRLSLEALGALYLPAADAA